MENPHLVERRRKRLRFWKGGGTRGKEESTTSPSSLSFPFSPSFGSIHSYMRFPAPDQSTVLVPFDASRATNGRVRSTLSLSLSLSLPQTGETPKESKLTHSPSPSFLRHSLSSSPSLLVASHLAVLEPLLSLLPLVASLTSQTLSHAPAAVVVSHTNLSLLTPLSLFLPSLLLSDGTHCLMAVIDLQPRSNGVVKDSLKLWTLIKLTDFVCGQEKGCVALLSSPSSSSFQLQTLRSLRFHLSLASRMELTLLLSIALVFTDESSSEPSKSSLLPQLKLDRPSQSTSPEIPNPSSTNTTPFYQYLHHLSTSPT